MNQRHTPQSTESRDFNELRRRILPEEQFVWGVFNSGDPIWNDNPCSIELVLFETKHTALSFVREILQKYWQVDASGLTDDAVEDLMWNEDCDPERYLHLYELKIHPDDYRTINTP
jgi:hypothetical protein